MNGIKDFNFFEKIVIKDPSALVCTWLIVQLIVLAQFFDKGHDPGKNGRSSFQHWYGFWVFAPTYAFYLILMIYIVIEQAGAAKSISDVYNLVAPKKKKAGTVEYARVPNVLELDNLSVGSVLQPDNPAGAESAQAQKRKREREREDYIDGYKMGPGDYERESALNRALINKVLLTLPTIFIASCKISFDRHDEYSWHLVLLWLYLYFGFFLAVAVMKGNWFMRSQREIDIEDEFTRLHLKTEREKAMKQIYDACEKAVLDQEETSDEDGNGDGASSDGSDSIENHSSNNNNQKKKPKKNKKLSKKEKQERLAAILLKTNEDVHVIDV